MMCSVVQMHIAVLGERDGTETYFTSCDVAVLYQVF